MPFNAHDRPCEQPYFRVENQLLHPSRVSQAACKEAPTRRDRLTQTSRFPVIAKPPETNHRNLLASTHLEAAFIGCATDIPFERPESPSGLCFPHIAGDGYVSASGADAEADYLSLTRLPESRPVYFG